VINFEGVETLVLNGDSLSHKELSELVSEIIDRTKNRVCPEGFCDFTILWYDYSKKESFMAFEKAKDEIEAATNALLSGNVPYGVNFSVFPVKIPSRVKFKPVDAD